MKQSQVWDQATNSSSNGRQDSSKHDILSDLSSYNKIIGKYWCAVLMVGLLNVQSQDCIVHSQSLEIVLRLHKQFQDHSSALGVWSQYGIFTIYEPLNISVFT